METEVPLLNIGMHKMEPKELAKMILASAVLYQLWMMTNEKVMNVDTKTYTNRVKYILCDNCQEALQILSTHTPEEFMLMLS